MNLTAIALNNFLAHLVKNGPITIENLTDKYTLIVGAKPKGSKKPESSR